MYAFEAFLVRPSRRTFAPEGTSVPLCALLPETAGAIPMSRYEALQSAYDYELEILNVMGRAIIIARTVVGSVEDIRGAMNEFANRINFHLGYLTTVV